MKTRTSGTHPLEIGVAQVPGGGEIGMTLFPGRIDRLSAFAPWQRDLDADLAVIGAWHPAMIVSLVQDFEFALLGVADFPQRLRAFASAEGIAWVHLPILDGGVPDAEFETAWNESEHRRARRYARAERCSYTAEPGSGERERSPRGCSSN